MPAEDSPLGFLAALGDQLLGSSAPPPVPVIAEFGSDIEAPSGPTAPVEPVVPQVPGAPPAPANTEPAAAPVQGAELLAQLNEALSALAEALGSGQPVDPDLIKRANDAAQAVVNQLGIPLQPFMTPAAPNDDPFALAALAPSRPEDAHGATVTVAPGAIVAPPASDAFGGLAATLANLLGVPSDGPPPKEGPAPSIPLVIASTPSAPPLPAIAALATKLADVGRTLQAEAPELAHKLEALGKVLNAAEAQPDLLRNLTTTSDARGTDLDRLVRNLIDAKAMAAPLSQLAAPPPLRAPAEIIAAAATIDEAVAPSDADTAHVAQRLTLAATSAVTETARTRVVAEAKPDAAPVQAATPAAVESAPAQNVATTAIAPHAAPIARGLQTAYQPIAAQAGTVPQFAFEMVRQFHQGQSRFTIRLDPPELGRVDVKMHVDAAGNVSARLTVERAETLDMFQRDHRTLERAMAQAGLDSNKTSLEFSLRQNPFSMSGQGGQGGNAYAPSFEGGLDMAEDESAIPSVILYRGTASSGGVNLFV
ncbi:MAG: flagellar hook-length control protein FliK [Devosia sp.]